MRAVSNAIRRVSKSWDAWLPVVLLAASLATNVYLVWVLRRGHGPRHLPSAVLKVGQRLPVLSVQDLGGRTVTIDWAADKRPALVYIFRESCSWCARNVANIRALSEAPNLEYRVIGLSLSDEGLGAYVRTNGFSFPVYKNVRLGDGGSFNADGTPETLVISPGGTITQRWLGAYAGSLKRDTERTIGVKLPGLLNDPATRTPAT